MLLGRWRGAPVAVKVLKAEIVQASPSALANFQREAKLLQDLRHPNVIEFFGSCLEVQPVWVPASELLQLFTYFSDPSPFCARSVKLVFLLPHNTRILLWRADDGRQPGAPHVWPNAERRGCRGRAVAHSICRLMWVCNT